jgi:SH3 domain-containing protein
MDHVIRTFLSFTLILAFGSVVFAQDSPKLRKFQTTYKIDMYAEAEVNAKKIGDVPTGVILEALEETQRYGGYIKVTYKNKTGYVFKAEVQRYMDVPAPELACWSNGYKIIGSVYRYFFVLRNDGTLPYVGKITVRLFDKDGKVLLEKTADYSDGFKPDAAEQFLIDMQVEAPQFELEHKDGKIKGGTGKFIERL